MIISKVIAISPTGEPPYKSQYGLLYPFTVTFSDGTFGKVNAKEANGPAYRVGDVVGYEITKNVNGVNIIKVDKKAATAPGAAPAQVANPPTPTAQAVPGQRAAPAVPTAHVQSIHRHDPAAIGMSLKLAGDVLMHNARAAAVPIDLASLAGNLWEVANSILEAGNGLASGVKPKMDEAPF